MSLENVKEYARRCGSDPELRKNARAIGIENIDEHIRVAADMGLDWSWSDLKAFQKELSAAQEGVEDLSEQELEEVAGGAFLGHARGLPRGRSRGRSRSWGLWQLGPGSGLRPEHQQQRGAADGDTPTGGRWVDRRACCPVFTWVLSHLESQQAAASFVEGSHLSC